MELPTAYLEQTLEALLPLCAHNGSLPIKVVQSAIGKAARVGHVVPDTSPFVSSLWGGYAAGRAQAADGKEGTSPHMLPARRFAVSATWFCTLLREALRQEDFGALAMRRTMGNNRQKLSSPSLPTLSFDASPWGGGGILWRNGVAHSYTHFLWNDHSLAILRAERGSCEGQTAFEFFTLFMCTVAFSEVLSESGARIRGDNLGALNVALDLTSTSPAMNTIAREIAWRRIVHRWQYYLKHLPAKLNDEADALSRLQAVPRRDFPTEALQAACFIEPPAQDDRLWRARLVLR